MVMIRDGGSGRGRGSYLQQGDLGGEVQSRSRLETGTRFEYSPNEAWCVCVCVCVCLQLELKYETPKQHREKKERKE